MIYEPSWQYYVHFMNVLKGIENIVFYTDTEKSITKEFLSGYQKVVFFYHDPLEELYPDIYSYAKKVEKHCRELGILMVNKPDPLSWTKKSTQLRILKSGGINVALTYNLEEVIDKKVLDVNYPVFVRYDAGHDSLGESYVGPFFSYTELIEGIKKQEWKHELHFKDTVVIEWIDTSVNNIYRKYRVFVFGGTVIKGPGVASDSWFVHEKDQKDDASLLNELEVYFQEPVTNKEKDIFISVNKLLSLDFSAIDYSYTKTGEIIVWEANPHPALSSNWYKTRNSFITNLAECYLDYIINL